LLDVEDPFKTVLFEDIKPLLFDIKSETVKHSAIHSMLQYLGLDAQMGVPSSIAYSDPFLCNNFSSEPASKFFMEGDDDVVQLNMPMHRYPNSLWNLLGCKWPAVYESNNLYTISQFGLNQLDGVNSILSQSRDILPDFISSHLLMLQSFTESAEKKAKR
jgi:hypothetical protein